MVIRTAGGMAPIHLPERRCFAISCPYHVRGLPPSQPVVTCDCGIMFCSESCQERHRDHGHNHACSHIKAARSVSASSRSTETAAETAAAQQQMEQNASWPCLIWRGRAFSLRFRVGQRIECMVHLAGFQPGTIVGIGFLPEENSSNLFPYEIEMDTGRYTSAPMDHDAVIRRLHGAPVFCDRYPLPSNLLPGIRQEFLSGMQQCTAARGNAATTVESPVLDKYRCSCCAKISRAKLSVCKRCRTAAYCDAVCQKKHYQEHRVACKAVGKARQEFKDNNPDLAKSKEGKRFLKRQALTYNRFEMIMTFMQDKTGLNYGAARFLRSLMHRAFEIYRSSNNATTDSAEAALRQFAQTLLENEMERMVSEVVVTSDALARLVAAVLYFRETAPDLSAWCSVAVSLWFEVSRLRPVIPREDPEDHHHHEPGDDILAQLRGLSA